MRKTLCKIVCYTIIPAAYATLGIALWFFPICTIIVIGSLVGLFILGTVIWIFKMIGETIYNSYCQKESDNG